MAGTGAGELRGLERDRRVDRPALGAIVFNDDAARAKLNGIVHPRVRERANQLVAEAPPDAIVVQDVPLLVEGGMAARFALVVVVHADVETRVARLVGQRVRRSDDVASAAVTASKGRITVTATGWGDPDGEVGAALRSSVEGTVAALLDERVLIPMRGQAESLNVAMAGAVLMYEAMRQRYFDPERR
mgnify:CR=1 FL=1